MRVNVYQLRHNHVIGCRDESPSGAEVEMHVRTSRIRQGADGSLVVRVDEEVSIPETELDEEEIQDLYRDGLEPADIRKNLLPKFATNLPEFGGCLPDRSNSGKSDRISSSFPVCNLPSSKRKYCLAPSTSLLCGHTIPSII